MTVSSLLVVPLSIADSNEEGYCVNMLHEIIEGYGDVNENWEVIEEYVGAGCVNQRECPQLSRCCLVFAVDFLCVEVEAFVTDHGTGGGASTCGLADDMEVSDEMDETLSSFLGKKYCASFGGEATATVDFLPGHLWLSGYPEVVDPEECSWYLNEGGCSVDNESHKEAVYAFCHEAEAIATSYVMTATAHSMDCIGD